MSREPGTGGARDLPELELECMKVLWESGPLTVRAVREHLLSRRPLAYTTVLTVLDRLMRKGVVTRRKRGRAHVYAALYTQDAARQAALARLLEHYFGGSRTLLLEHLLPARRATRAARAASSAEEANPLDPALL